MRPWLQERGARATTVLATGPLEELTQELQAEWGALHIVDARRPKLEAQFTSDAAASGGLRSFLLGFGVLLALQAD